MDQNVFHKLQLEILNAIDLLLLTMTYGICWYAYYGDEISTPFYNLGNEIMVALFAILYYFISHLYHGYRISISRISDLVYSQTGSLLCRCDDVRHHCPYQSSPH